MTGKRVAKEEEPVPAENIDAMRDILDVDSKWCACIRGDALPGGGKQRR